MDKSLVKGRIDLQAHVRNQSYLRLVGAGSGESPEWVARTPGHVDGSMVYRTYGRYLPNLTRQDGSAFERQYSEATKRKGNPNTHNRENLGCPGRITNRNPTMFSWSGRLDLNQRPLRPERSAPPD